MCVVGAEELAWLGSVRRTLTLDVGGLEETVLPASVPADFHGNVDMSAPQLLVDVHIKNKSSGDDSDDHADNDHDDDRSNSDEDSKQQSSTHYSQHNTVHVDHDQCAN